MQKLTIHNANLTATIEQFNDEEVGQGHIPDNLAKATLTILAFHKANGDLAWVEDMVKMMEEAKYGLDGGI